VAIRTVTKLVLLLAAALTGCAAPRSDPPAREPARVDASNPIMPAPVEAEGDAPVPSASEQVLWAMDVDLDGDGEPEHASLRSRDVVSHVGELSSHTDTQAASASDERVDIPILECTTDRDDAAPCRGQLTIGTQSIELILHSGFFGGIGIRVVDLDDDDGRRELLLTHRGDAEEDPPYLFSIVQWDGTAITLTPLWHSNGYSTGTVTIDSSGVFEVFYDECPDAYAVSYVLRDGRLHEGEVVSKRVRNPDECAACPRAYVLEAAGFAYKGEILRDLDRAELAGEQRLAFTRAQRFRSNSDGRVTIELREEEPEISHIDAVALELDGRRILPVGCEQRSSAICHVDGHEQVLRRGDTLRLEFEVGELDADSRVALVAVGYYVPTP
jgi:hypothetical protein